MLSSRRLSLLALAICPFAIIAAFALVGSFTSVSAQDSEPTSQPAQPEMSEAERTAYSLGVLIGQQLKSQCDRFEAGGEPLQVDVIFRAMNDVLAGAELKVAEDQCQTSYMAALRGLDAKLAEANKAKGAEFLAAKAQEADVKATGSGLLYKVINEGSGEMPTTADRVKVHYKGTLIDGTQFDSSYDRGQPATFGVTQVIKGWTEALQLMKVGAKYELYIPAELAYGPVQKGPIISPNSTLVFEVELLEIVK